MAKGRDKNYVSIGFWILTFFVMAIPLLNIIMTFVWAFSGDNESLRNYFKAMIIVWLFVVGLMILAVSLGAVPIVIDQLQKFQRLHR